jgi:NADPH:quinone reductase-like Zn-dependent oxidoreductase
MCGISISACPDRATNRRPRLHAVGGRLTQIPFAEFVKHAERGILKTTPAHVFAFNEIVEAHRLMESGEARGKIVVRAPER